MIFWFIKLRWGHFYFNFMLIRYSCKYFMLIKCICHLYFIEKLKLLSIAYNFLYSTSFKFAKLVYISKSRKIVRFCHSSTVHMLFIKIDGVVYVLWLLWNNIIKILPTFRTLITKINRTLLVFILNQTTESLICKN